VRKHGPGRGGAGEDLLFTLEDGIGWITFHRPQARNAFTFAMYERLSEICERANTDRSIKVLLLREAGDKAFAAGTDINQFSAFKTPQDALDYENRIDRVLGTLERSGCRRLPRSLAPAPAAARA
jgi:enoyl-CoA hydratase/carnithine racemase